MRSRLHRAASRAPRGLLHGLSLIVLTMLLLAGLALWLTAGERRACVCNDRASVDAVCRPSERAQGCCDRVCAHRGGGAPLLRSTR